MRLRLLALTALLFIATAASAKEVWLSIGGTTAGGTFRTDARIFNPSTTKDIQIQAYYLPVGNVDNSARPAAGADHGSQAPAGRLQRRRRVALS